jgi:hypothetical protein
VGGLVHSGFKIIANDWIFYGLHGLVWSRIQDVAWTWLTQTLFATSILLVIYLFVARWRASAKDVDLSFARLTGWVCGAVLLARTAYLLNRYTFKPLWDLTRSQDWSNWAPEIILNPKLWYLNLGLVVLSVFVALIISYVVRRSLRWLHRGPQRRLGLTFAAIDLVLALPLILSLLWAPHPPNSMPNIILISADTLRADRLGIYGYERNTSPALDAFARRGAVFENNVAQANWTLPSHMSIMTSQMPSVHGVRDANKRLAKFKITLAEILRNQGYLTQAFTGGYYVDSRFGYDQGFQDYQGDQLKYFAVEEKWLYGKGPGFPTFCRPPCRGSHGIGINPFSFSCTTGTHTRPICPIPNTSNNSRPATMARSRW